MTALGSPPGYDATIFHWRYACDTPLRCLSARGYYFFSFGMTRRVPSASLEPIQKSRAPKLYLMYARWPFAAAVVTCFPARGVPSPRASISRYATRAHFGAFKERGRCARNCVAGRRFGHRFIASLVLTRPRFYLARQQSPPALPRSDA